MIPPVVMVPVGVEVRTRVPVNVIHNFVRGNQVPILSNGHTADPGCDTGSVPIRGPPVRHQLYWNVIHRLS